VRPVKIVSVIFGISAAVLLLLALSAALFIKYYPKEYLLEFVTNWAESALNRKVFIKDISYGLGEVTLEEVRIYESDSDRAPLIFGSEYVDLRFSLISLLKLNLDFDKITVRNAACNIVFDNKGISNIQKLYSAISSKGDSGLSAKISRLSLFNTAISLESPTKNLAPLAGTYRMTGKIRIDDSIKIYGCTIQLPDQRGKISPEITVEILKDNFMVTGSVALENASLLWVYRWGKGVSLPYNYINGKVEDLVVTKNYVKGRARATSTLLNTGKLLRMDGSCQVDLGAGKVLISQTAGSIDSSNFFIENLDFTTGGKINRFSIKNINAVLSDLMPLIKIIPSKLFGTVTGGVSYAGGAYNGTMTLADFGWDPETKIISGLNATLLVSDNMFKVTDAPFKLYSNPCLLSIASTERTLSKLFINISSETVSIDPEGNKFAASDEPLNIPVEISGNISVGKLIYPPHKASNIQFQYDLAGNSLKIKTFQFLYAGGRVNGNGVIRIPQGTAQATLALNFDNLEAQEIINSNPKIRNRFFGTIKGNSKIDFELSSKILQTARGNVEFTIHGGRLVDTGIQDGLGTFLSGLKYKLRDLEFNKIYGNIDIRGTMYHIRSFIFNSNAIRLKVTGDFDINLNANPLSIDLEFSKSFIQDLPGPSSLVINKYLRGEWYTIPFIMNGDMTDSRNIKQLD
jgi:hypothetical protein